MVGNLFDCSDSTAKVQKLLVIEANYYSGLLRSTIHYLGIKNCKLAKNKVVFRVQRGFLYYPLILN